MNQWEVWYARFPFEEDGNIEKERPVIILNVETLKLRHMKCEAKINMIRR